MPDDPIVRECAWHVQYTGHPRYDVLVPVPAGITVAAFVADARQHHLVTHGICSACKVKFRGEMKKNPPATRYTPRFISDAQLSELFNLYHLARAAGKSSRYDRLIWASREFSKEHPSVSSTAAYKDLDAAIKASGLA